MKTVTSRTNPWYRGLLRLAQSSRERRKSGRTLLDGIHLVEAWIGRFGPPEELVFSESGLVHPEVARLAAGGAGTVLADPLFAALTELPSPTGVIAVVEVPGRRAEQVTGECAALLEGIQDPGNLGSIVRSAAAAGIGSLHLSAGCADAWAPRTLRAAMGGHFGLQVRDHADLERVAREFPGRVIAAGARGGKSLFDADLRGPVAFAFGAEGGGLSEGLVCVAHEVVAIPMPGGMESLNVAAAAAVCFFERVRQRSRGAQ